MSYQSKIMQENPVGFWRLDESSGTTAYDFSGCSNNGTYSGTFNYNILPLVSGGTRGTLITNSSYITLPVTKNYYAVTAVEGLATKYTSDNDFTLEAWIYPMFYGSSNDPQKIFGTNETGIFWQKGNIIFKAGGESVEYTLPYIKKSIYVVAVYTTKSIIIYIDGIQAASKSLSNFKFSATNFEPSIGPCNTAQDSFIVDAPAIYRYALTEPAIKKHYVDGNITSSAIQVVFPDEGVLFSGTDANIKSTYEYSYPINKKWEDILSSNTYYENDLKYVSFYSDLSGAQTFIYQDEILIPNSLGISTSKIEWRDSENISVRSSVDGINWQVCSNGSPIPQYKIGSFSSEYKLYLEITMTTSDVTKYKPKLSFFCVSFYSDRSLYADNYGDKITSTSDYNLSSIKYPVLSRNYMNGIRPLTDKFTINTLSQIKSIEMIYTPTSSIGNGLVNGLSWNNAGLITKSNISKIYINNVDISSQTNISSYLVADQPHHIVVVFTSPITGAIDLNVGGGQNLYKNIAIYQKEITASICDTHFTLYVGQPQSSLTEPVVTLTDSELKYYNNDWVVIQSV